MWCGLRRSQVTVTTLKFIIFQKQQVFCSSYTTAGCQWLNFSVYLGITHHARDPDSAYSLCHEGKVMLYWSVWPFQWLLVLASLLVSKWNVKKSVASQKVAVRNSVCLSCLFQPIFYSKLNFHLKRFEALPSIMRQQRFPEDFPVSENVKEQLYLWALQGAVLSELCWFRLYH